MCVQESWHVDPEGETRQIQVIPVTNTTSRGPRGEALATGTFPGTRKIPVAKNCAGKKKKVSHSVSTHPHFLMHHHNQLGSCAPPSGSTQEGSQHSISATSSISRTRLSRTTRHTSDPSCTTRCTHTHKYSHTRTFIYPSPYLPPI